MGVTTGDGGAPAAPAWPGKADGVFRGGGVKGIGLAAAIEAMGRHPTKAVRDWVNVAGASAGAIIAGYLAVHNSPAKLLEEVRTMPYASFQDFPRGGKWLGGGLNLLFGRHGLAHGEAFEHWFDEKLGGATFADLRKPELEGRYRLQLIACDVENKRLLVLPWDLRDYCLPGKRDPIDPDEVRVSRAARMSMSIPFFYEPVKLEYIDQEDGGKRKPALIVDGGTLSNFPVWLFDVDPERQGKVPQWPTFGITLRGGRGVGGGVKAVLLEHAGWPLRFGTQIFDTAQSAWDTRFVSHSTCVRTFAVDAGGVGTTDFHLTADSGPIQALIRNGATAANGFLDEFDLAQYRNTFAARIPPQATVTATPAVAAAADA